MFRWIVILIGILIILPPSFALTVHNGWPISTTFTIWGPPIVADVDNDGRGDLIVVRTRADKVAMVDYAEVLAYSETGSQIFAYSEQGRCYPKCNQPAVGDVDGDGVKEILVSYIGNRILALTFSGTLKTTYTVTGASNLGPVALGDIDGDGLLEILVASTDGTVYAIRGSDGSVIWSYPTSSQIDTALALGELDNIDNGLEVVAADKNGNIYVIKNGAVLSGWPKSAGSGIVSSSPALGDIDDDGGIDIVVGTVDGRVRAYSSNGTVLSGWPKSLSESIETQPILGDINGDGKLEVVATTVDDGAVYAITGAGVVLSGFPVVTNDVLRASPALGDIDGGGVDIIIMTLSGTLYSINGDGTKSVLAQAAGTAAASAPTLWDIDGDGSVEIAMGTGGEHSGFYVWDATGSADLQMLPWPMLRRDDRNTGAYSPVARIVSPANNDSYTRLSDITFSGKGLSSYGAINSYTWTSSLEGIIESSSSSTNFTKRLSKIGTHVITLKVVDDFGREDTISRNIIVTNLPPSVSILFPVSGSVYLHHVDAISFEGSVSDPENDSIVSYEWRSSIDGVIGTSKSFSTSGLSIGLHIVNFTAIDQYGAVGRASIAVNVTNLPPSVSILFPVSGDLYLKGDAISFEGSVSDPENDSIVSYEWRSSIDGVIGTSKSFSTSGLSIGLHIVNFTAIDQYGAVGRASIVFGINPVIEKIVFGINPVIENVPPKAEISSPINASRFYEDEAITFKGNGSDPNGIVVGYKWISSIDGVMGNTSILTTDELSTGYHVISLVVADDAGLIAIDSIAILVLPLRIKVDITSPAEGASFESGTEVHFNSAIAYPFEIKPVYAWVLEGELVSNASSFNASNLKIGVNNISLIVSDGQRAEGRDSSYIIIIPKKTPATPEEKSVLPPLVGESVRKSVEVARRQLGNIIYGVNRRRLLPIGIGIGLLLGLYLILRRASVREYAKRFK